MLLAYSLNRKEEPTGGVDPAHPHGTTLVGATLAGAAPTAHEEAGEKLKNKAKAGKDKTKAKVHGEDSSSSSSNSESDGGAW